MDQVVPKWNVALTLLLVGASGQGKSSFGNTYLGGSFFKTSDLSTPMTNTAEVKYNSVDGVGYFVIDTKGFNEGPVDSQIQVSNLCTALKNHEKGVNGVSFVVHKTQTRFSRQNMDLIKLIHDLFKHQNVDVTSHLSFVFTGCDENDSNREYFMTDFADLAKEYIFNVSGTKMKDIPMFFIDPKRSNEAYTKRELDQFKSWISNLPPMTHINENVNFNIFK